MLFFETRFVNVEFTHIEVVYAAIYAVPIRFSPFEEECGMMRLLYLNNQFCQKKNSRC